LISIYNYDNIAIQRDRMMVESNAQAGLYIFELRAEMGIFTPGKPYTYVITEQTTGGLVSGSGIMESTSITAIAGLAAAAPEAERASKKVLEAVTTLQDVLISDNAVNIGLALTNLQESVEELPGLLGKQMDKGGQAKLLNQVADRLKSLIGDSEGIDLEGMLEEALGEDPTIKEIQSKTEAIQGVIKFLMQLFEAKLGGMDTPIVSTSLAPGSVKFRIAVANPSSSRVQTVPVQVYLPAEVKPGDIIDLAGLTLEYDSDKSIYYVHSDVELAPRESRLFEVEVEDIWFVDQKEVASLKQQANIAVERLKDTDYFESARLIGARITERLDGVLKSETNDEMLSRERHIGQYRTNMQEISLAKEDLQRIEKLLVQAGARPEPAMLENVRVTGEVPNRRVTWLVIFVILIFIALLAAVFFFTWNSQVRMTERLIVGARKEAFDKPKPFKIEEGEKEEGEKKE